jgi:hypothetical protein
MYVYVLLGLSFLQFDTAGTEVSNEAQQSQGLPQCMCNDDLYFYFCDAVLMFL